MSVGDVVEMATDLREEAIASNERRLLVIAGDRGRGYETVRDVLRSLPIPIAETVHVGPPDRLHCERVEPTHAESMLGTTKTLVVYDTHDELRPNTLGTLCGIVDGGGLMIMLTPSLDRWPETRDAFDETLAVPPYRPEDVGGRFRRRLVETLRAHTGIGIVSVTPSETAVEKHGSRRHPTRRRPESPTPPPDADFPAVAYEHCLTDDQVDAVRTLEALRTPGHAVVIEADRGRGKSSAAGIVAACLATEGKNVVVTAPAFRNAREVFDRADSVLDALEAVYSRADARTIDLGRGGSIRFVDPVDLDRELERDRADVLLVDEAAAIPVRALTRLLSVDRVAFVTTVHGYEGTGRGFAVRFRERLDRSDLEVVERRLTEPIRYAAGDPLEVWSFRALLLDARPPVSQLIRDATVESTRYRVISRDELIADERLLREAFGLLVLAHYRTDPNDLARLLDAPNLRVRALVEDGHVVAVSLLAEEGGLSSERRRDLYRGGRIRGHMIPDLLTSQLRDEEAGRPRGLRIVRIATHPAVRSRGLGSALLSEISAEFGSAVEWIGAGYGATPELVSFWRRNGFRTVHLSTTRNDRSGEHSAVMLDPTGNRGRDLCERHASWFADRIDAMLADALRQVDPDVIRAVCRSVDVAPSPALDERDWRVVVGAAYGTGVFDVDPGPFRRLALAALLDPAVEPVLSDRQERLLVRKALQGHPWGTVADDLGFVSTRTCMQALGRAYRPLVDRYGTDQARAEQRRFRRADDDREGVSNGDDPAEGDGP